MKIVMLYILSMVCTNIVAHPGSPLDGTHTETLAIVLMMTGKIVKEEVNIIWGDYFKEAQLNKFPETHKIVHLIMQYGSKCKQECNIEHAEMLLKHLNHFAEIFWATKGIRTEKVTAPYPPAKKVVIPVLISG